MIKDSGERTEFKTGAVRDIQEKKGRCDLLPLEEIAECYRYKLNHATDLVSLIFVKLNDWKKHKKNIVLTEVLLCVKSLNSEKWKSTEDMILDVSVHYREGAEKYGERNWEKGIPTHSYLDSAIRHLLKYARGDEDERHDRAFVWNILGLMWTMNNKPELDDIKTGGENEQQNS